MWLRYQAWLVYYHALRKATLRPIICKFLVIYSLQWAAAVSVPLEPAGLYWACVSTSAKACRGFEW